MNSMSNKKPAFQLGDFVRWNYYGTAGTGLIRAIHTVQTQFLYLVSYDIQPIGSEKLLEQMGEGFLKAEAACRAV